MSALLGEARYRIRPDFSTFDREAKTGLSRGLKVAGVAAAAAAGAAVVTGVKAGKYLKDAIGDASDLNESINAVQVTFPKASKGIQRLADDASTSLGLTKTEFQALSVQFSSFAKTVSEGTGKGVVKTMDDLTTRASDFASVMNLEVADAARIFQSGLAGETEPLKRFGIDLSAAAVEAYAYANGIAESGEKLSETEKVQARYGLLMKQTAKTQGDFANTSDELANSQRILAARYKDAKATLGSAFLPAAKAATGVLGDLVGEFDDAMTRVFGNKRVRSSITEVGDALADAFGGVSLDGVKPRRVAKFFENIADHIPGVADALRDDFLPSFKELVSQAKDIAVGTGSGAWTLISSIGDALGSMPAEWRDDIVKIGALLAVVSKVKPVGNIFGGIGNLFGKNGVLAGTKTMTVTAAAVYVNGKGAGGGGPVAGGKGGAASKGGRFARFGRFAPLAAGGAGALAGGAAAAGLLAPFVGIPALVQRDKNLPRKQYNALQQNTRQQIAAVINIEQGKVSGDPLVQWIAQSRPNGQDSLPNLFAQIIAQAEAGEASKVLTEVTADRIANIAAEAETRVATGKLDDAAALRIVELLAHGKVDKAERVLNNAARGRDTNITAVPKTAAYDKAMKFLTRTRTVDVAIRILTKKNEGPANDYPTGRGGYTNLETARQQIEDHIKDAKDKARRKAMANTPSASRSAGRSSSGRIFGRSYPVTQGYARHGYAMDFGTPVGTPVYAPWSGMLSNRSFFSNGRFYSYGRLATVSGAGGTFRVAHLSRFASSGRVSKGQLIGWTGNTGNSTGPHAHVEVIKGGRFVNPGAYVRYDTGGVLPHGGTAINLSRKPEAILTNKQWQAIERLGQGLNHRSSSGGAGVTVHVSGTPEQQVEQLLQRLRYESLLERSTI